MSALRGSCLAKPTWCDADSPIGSMLAEHPLARLEVPAKAAIENLNREVVMRYAFVVATSLAASVIAGDAQAADHEIQMRDKGEKGVMVFQPDFVRAALGDTVTFVPTNEGHNAESIWGMIPDGAKTFKGKAGEQFTVMLDKEGVYGVKCAPHFGMGMVALIVVGKPVNLAHASTVRQAGKAKKVFASLLAQVRTGN